MRAVWKVYHDAAEAEGTIHPVACTHHLLLIVANIGAISRCDEANVCWQCQQNSAGILRMANGPEAEKTATIINALEHLRVVKMERTHYKCSGTLYNQW